jgi:hypothetical protein
MKSSAILLMLFPVLIVSCKTEMDMDSIIHPIEISSEISLFVSYAPSGIRIRPVEVILTTNLYDRKGAKVSGLYVHRKQEIYLDTTSYYYKNTKIALVMHELGHAVLKRDEVTGLRPKDDPWYPYTLSFMNLEAATPRDILLNDRPELLEALMTELFL